MGAMPPNEALKLTASHRASALGRSLAPVFYRRGGALVFAIVSTLGAVGCQDIAPERAPGFQPSKLAGVTIGMSEEELVALLGSPLPTPSGMPPAPYQVAHYATRGARWWLGEYRSNVRGDDCLFWLQDGKVVAARYLNEVNQKLCRCEKGNCPAEWARPCIDRQ
jgi:hypothetical protein